LHFVVQTLFIYLFIYLLSLKYSRNFNDDSFSVTSTYREPVIGWIDNLYGPTGVVAGAGSGVLRTM
jgi:hypothetical protein